MMNPSPETRPSNRPDPEATLRLLAELPPPEGLADRVHHRIAAAPLASSRPGFWALWMPVRRLQFAGAALLVTAIAASSWTIYENRQHATPAARSLAPQPAPQQPSGLSTAGAERHPASLKPIKVPPAPKKKPSAAKSRAIKPATASPTN